MGTGGVFLRKLRAKITDAPTGFVWVERGKLAGSGYPASRTQVEWLVKSGIRSILTLTSEPLPSEWTEGFSITSGHVAMEDHEAPSLAATKRGVDFVVEQLNQRRPVVVHCLAGEGRTGCVLAAYLIRARGVGAKEAMETLRKIKPEFVEQRQEKSVYEYAESMPPVAHA